MTIYEHAMVGINGSLAFGLHRRHGWQIIVLAGVAAVLPDLDGLTLVLSKHFFALGHRVWTHNFFVVGLLAGILAVLCYSLDIFTRIQRLLARKWAVFGVGDQLPVVHKFSCGEVALWVIVALLAAYSHLLADVVFSIGNGLPVWGLPLLWPFCHTSFAYPLVPWGDIGGTIIFAASMFLMIRWPSRAQMIAGLSLALVVCYVMIRGSCELPRLSVW